MDRSVQGRVTIVFKIHLRDCLSFDYSIYAYMCNLHYECLNKYCDPSLNGTVRFPPLNGTEKEKLIKGVSSCHIDLFHTPLEAP